MIERKRMRGLQAPNSLPLWHQAPKRKLLVILTISIGLSRIIIITSWNFLTAVVKLNIIITLRGHIVIPRIVDTRRSRIIPRLTNRGARKICLLP